MLVLLGTITSYEVCSYLFHEINFILHGVHFISDHVIFFKNIVMSIAWGVSYLSFVADKSPWHIFEWRCRHAGRAHEFVFDDACRRLVGYFLLSWLLVQPYMAIDIFS